MKFKLVSLGCKVNSYECSAIRKMLVDQGYQEALKGDIFDIGIINTCAVTNIAERKSRQHIRKLRKENPNAIIVAMGCYTQKHHNEAIEDCDADIVVGTSNRKLIPQLIDNYIKTHKKVDFCMDNPRTFKYEELGAVACSENTRAYLKIQDGCNSFCSYCIIPYRRGIARSRKKEDIIEEAKSLISMGYQEIVITGIHIGTYGYEMHDTSFYDLMKTISELPGLNRLRISSIEMNEVTDELIELIKNNHVFARHLHIPLQSGSTSVLSRMNRKYTKDEFVSKCKTIKKQLPDIAITTDVIVGFPNETEDEFKDTVDTIMQSDINMVHVFPFSLREGTAIASVKDNLKNDVKERRVHELLDLSNVLWDKYLNRCNNSLLSVLIERYDKKTNKYIGHSSNYIEVKVESDKNLVGKFIEITYKKDNE